MPPRSHTSAPLAVVRRNWIIDAAKAINRKIGATLADAMQSAAEDSIFEPLGLDLLNGNASIPPSASTNTTTSSSANGDSAAVPASAVDAIIHHTRAALLAQLQQLPLGPEHDDSDNKLYVEVLVRIVAANAVYRQVLQAPPPTSPVNDDDAQALLQPASPTSARSQALVGASNKLVQGLLHAFEALQEVHMLDRSGYRTAKLTKQQLNSSAETPGWDTVPLMTLVHMIQRAAQTAGSAVSEEALTQLVRSWRKLLIFLQTADNGVAPEFSRRRGSLAVVNGLLIMLFQHNNTHQCRALLQSVEQNEKIADTTGNVTKSVLRPAAHMIAEVVKFRYYQGRMKLYEKKFAEASECFTIAYRMVPPIGSCSQPQRDNKRRIHFYRIVTGIVSGQEPPAAFLDSDALCRHLFMPIVEAIREGNPAGFCRALDRNASIFRRRGVYMLLQQARILSYLYLLQRVHAAIGSLPGTDNTKIPIPVVVEAAKLVMGGRSVADDADLETALEGEGGAQHPPPAKKSRIESMVVDTLDADATCLWIARLISRGFVRGYLSYEHQTLVLSKAAPFPSILPPPAAAAAR